MLIFALAALFLALPSYPTEARLVIRAPSTESSPIEWLILDSKAEVTEKGRTPSDLSLKLSTNAQTICAVRSNQQLDVSLLVPASGISINGTAGCFQFGIINGQISLTGVLDPRIVSE